MVQQIIPMSVFPESNTGIRRPNQTDHPWNKIQIDTSNKLRRLISHCQCSTEYKKGIHCSSEQDIIGSNK